MESIFCFQMEKKWMLWQYQIKLSDLHYTAQIESTMLNGHLIPCIFCVLFDGVDLSKYGNEYACS